MDRDDLEGVLAFIKRAENLKNTFRFSFTSTGKRESSAEHSWRLCLLVLLFSDALPDLDLEKCFKLAVVHDLAEAVCGDIPAIYQEDNGKKSAMELAALTDMTRPLPGTLGQAILALWQEYDQAATEEARYVKALDKIETLVQHNQGRNPPDFNYAFNLAYGVEATNKIAVLKKLRTMIDEETARKAGISACSLFRSQVISN